MKKAPKPDSPAQRKFDGRTCVQISIEEMQKDDYIFYHDKGRRVGKVQKNHRGYKHRWVKLCPTLYGDSVLRRSRKIKHEAVISVWRPLVEESS